MAKFVFQNIDFPTSVWREGDPPLVNGSVPVIEHQATQQQPDDAPPVSAKPLLAVGCICCWLIGCWLLAFGARWQTPLTGWLSLAWSAACIVAAVLIKRTA